MGDEHTRRPGWRRHHLSVSNKKCIPDALHAPYPDLQENICRGGILHELADATRKRILFYCAFGERSAMAVQAAQDAGLKSACHIEGGIDAWTKANGPLTQQPNTV